MERREIKPITDREELGLNAVRQWLKIVTVGFTDVSIVHALTITKEFYESLGLDWDEEMNKLENELFNLGTNVNTKY